jgi:hypothetical protein
LKLGIATRLCLIALASIVCISVIASFGNYPKTTVFALLTVMGFTPIAWFGTHAFRALAAAALSDDRWRQLRSSDLNRHTDGISPEFL